MSVRRNVRLPPVPPGSIQMTEAVRSWYDTAARARKGEAVVLTHHGRPDVVLLGYDDYEALTDGLRDAARRITELEAKVAQGTE